MLLMSVLASCEKVEFDFNTVDDGNESKTKVTFRVNTFQQKPFGTRSSLSDYSTHLDIAIFDSSGTRVAKVNQKSTDDQYGSLSLYLAPGDYTINCIAHNGGNAATMTTLEEVSFTNNKTTDTFLASQEFTVADASISEDITLERCVAMVRFIITDDNIPAEVSQFKFYYTGGSSTLNPITGFGAKQSKQTEIRTLAEAPRDEDGHPIFEIYTFPHEDYDLLKITLTPQTSAGEDLTSYECVFTNVPVTINTVSEHSGSIFEADASATALNISLNPHWASSPSTF